MHRVGFHDLCTFIYFGIVHGRFGIGTAHHGQSYLPHFPSTCGLCALIMDPVSFPTRGTSTKLFVETLGVGIMVLEHKRSQGLKEHNAQIYHHHNRRGSISLQQYVYNCWVDTNVMQAHGVKIMQGYFRNEAGKEILVHIPTIPFFVLHAIDLHARELWDHMIFDLPPWGLTIKEAGEAFLTMTADHHCVVTNLNGHKDRLYISR